MVADPAQGGVDRDAIQPAAHARRAAERVQRLERAHEHLLRDVGGVGVVAQIAPHDPPDAALMAAHELIERHALARLEAGHQVTVEIALRDHGPEQEARKQHIHA